MNGLRDEELELSNLEMEVMLNSLAMLMNRNDIFGYLAFRNTRMLENAAHEYLQKKRELLERYGQPVLDKDGNETGTIKIQPENAEYKAIRDALVPLCDIRHRVVLSKIDESEAINKLTGAEMLQCSFLFTSNQKGGQ